MYDDDDEPIEPEMPRIELRETALRVVATVAIAAILLAAGVLSAGTLNTILVLAAPTVIFLGAGVLGYRAWQVQRAGGRWQIYQGGMWLLLLIFLLWIFSAVGAVLS
ncbi:MAG: hypothetical protein WAW85_13030 [Gordonia sp. (in: high G+C Gram-positive bacteria)]|uniref:hypothetical protein n=1 Tax=Gordonia sp. (in: high G+C Gram-positive bacteria) TaxID=84139 RepID=UPI003BB48AA4